MGNRSYQRGRDPTADTSGQIEPSRGAHQKRASRDDPGNLNRYNVAVQMANSEHMSLLQQGVKPWNAWRRKHPRVKPDLSAIPVSEVEHEIGMLAAAVVNEAMPGAAPPDEGGLSGVDLAGADLHDAKLRGVNLSRANLMLADLRNADLRHANLTGTIMTSGKLSNCDFRDAIMNGAILRFATLGRARFEGAMLRLCNLDGVDARRASFQNTDLSFASLNEARFTGANLSGSFVYGCSAWNVDLMKARQQNLRITRTRARLLSTI